MGVLYFKGWYLTHLVKLPPIISSYLGAGSNPATPLLIQLPTGKAAEDCLRPLIPAHMKKLLCFSY